MNDTRHTLFIVDDHRMIIDGIRGMIKDHEQWQIIGDAQDGEEALSRIPILKPDLVVLDLDMPKYNGLQVCEKLLQSNPDQKIVILTLHFEKPIIEKLLKLGVSGYILKNAPMQEFLQGIQMVMTGTQFYSSQLTESMLSISSLSPNPETNVKLLSTLTERERDILLAIAEGSSSKTMAEQLNLSVKTIESYRKNLIQKLKAKNTADLIRIGIKEGFIPLD